MLDEMDKKIINLLQKGDMCGPKVNKIAELLDAPSSTVHTRIRKLEKKGLIKGYEACVDPKKAGKPLTMFSWIKLEYPKKGEDFAFDEEIGRIISSNPEVQEVHTMTGEWELLLKMKVADQEDYYRIAREGIIKKGKGKIIKVKGLNALSTLKENHRIIV